MKYNVQHTPAFTLVEILVAMSILGIMMVSIIGVFVFSSQMSHLVDLNRVSQENMKNVLEDVAEGIRKDGLIGVRNFGDANCLEFSQGSTNVQSGTILCLSQGDYSLGYRDSSGNFLPVENPDIYCPELQHVCYIIKKQLGGTWYPMTQSFLSFQKMDIVLLHPELPKVHLLLEARPAANKGLSPEIAANNIIRVQTTLSERLIKTN